MNERSNLFCVDTETTGLVAWKGHRPFAVSVCDDEGGTRYIDFPVCPKTRRVIYSEKSRRSDLSFLKRMLSNPSITKVFFNSKFDVRMLEMALGIKVEGRLDDVLYMARVVNSGETSYGLKYLASKYLEGVDDSDEKELKKEVAKARAAGKRMGVNLADDLECDYWLPKFIDPNNAACEKYAVSDVFPRTLGLYYLYVQLLEEDSRLAAAYNIELKIRDIIYRMETRGVRVDLKMNGEMITAAQSVENTRLKRMLRVAGSGFNPRSQKQLASVMYDKLGMQCHRYTEGGGRSTDWKALQPHTAHPFIDDLNAYRSATKAIEFYERYLDLAIPDHISEGEWSLHPSFNQDRTRTFRLSCNDPNLQNTAKAESSFKPYPIEARAQFGPRKGYLWLLCDYAQQELRIFADRAHETNMLESFFQGRDVNTDNANLCWGGDTRYAWQAAYVALELSNRNSEVWKKAGVNRDDPKAARKWLAQFDFDIVKAERSLGKSISRTKAKMVAYAKIYGGSARAVKDLLFMSLEDAEATLGRFDQIFPEIGAFCRDTTERARKTGEIVTAYGRVLQVDSDMAYRGINYMIQGSAADMIKAAMIRLDDMFEDLWIDAHLVMSIHDELVMEIAEEEFSVELVKKIKESMEDLSGSDLTVPMSVECAVTRTGWNGACKSKVDV